MSEIVKLVVVGDGGVGKTTLLMLFVDKKIYGEGEFNPSMVFDNWAGDIDVGGEKLNLGLWDTAGQDEYDRLRPLSYPGTDLFFLCFSVVNRDSFEHVCTKWIPELHLHRPEAKIVLIGTKCDLRDDPTELAKHNRGPHVTTAEGQELANEIGAMSYQESTKFDVPAITEMFYAALIAYRHPPRGWFARRASPAPLSPPTLPVKPQVAIQCLPKSTYAADLAATVGSPTFSDVDLHVGGQVIPAHRLLLCMGSPLWRRVFGCSEDDAQAVTHEQINAGALLPAIGAVAKRRGRIAVALGKDVTVAATMAMLRFVYGGMADNDAADNTADTARRFFGIDELQSNKEIEISVTHSHNERCATWARENVVAKPLFADVVFELESDETMVCGHRILLHARSKWMAKLFDGQFADGRARADGVVRSRVGGDTKSVSFRAMLFYLITDSVPVGRIDWIDLLQLAHRFQLPSLIAQCGAKLSQEINSSVTGRILHCDTDLIGILKMAQTHGAEELVHFLRQFFSINHTTITQLPEWQELDDEQKDGLLIEADKWPPKQFFERMRAFELRQAATKVSVMERIFGSRK